MGPKLLSDGGEVEMRDSEIHPERTALIAREDSEDSVLPQAAARPLQLRPPLE
jgi:hypothetical protein